MTRWIAAWMCVWGLVFYVGGALPTHAQRAGCFKLAYINGMKDPAMPKYWMGQGMATLDMNKDGHKDLLISAVGPKKVFVYFGGPALFDTTADLELRGSARLVTGDFDGDGLTDLAAHVQIVKEKGICTEPDSVLVYMGVRDSAYALETTPRHAFTFPQHPVPAIGTAYMGDYLYAADLDGDGRDEVIAGTHQGSDFFSGVCIWHYPNGDASDTLTSVRTSTAKYGGIRRSIEVGDVNGDGLGDIVVAVVEIDSAGLPHPPRVRIGFGAPGKYPDLSKPDQFLENDVLGYTSVYERVTGSFWVTLLDVNNDGADDLLWVPCLDSLWIMYGGPDGLSGKVDRIFPNHDTERWTGGMGWRHHRIGDYNGDGWNDFIIQYGAEGFPAMVVVGGDANGLTNEPLGVCVGAGYIYGGRVVVDMGDVDGDGDDEHVISDPQSPVPDLPFDPGFAAVIEGQDWVILGTNDMTEEGPTVTEPFSVDLYPAPSGGDVYINLKTESPGEYLLRLHTLEGKLVYERRYELTQRENMLILPTQELSGISTPAILLIRISHHGQHVQRKLVLG